MKINNLTIKDLYETKDFSQISFLNIHGWVISNRNYEKISFITINDGSTFNDLQIVVKNPDQTIQKIKLGTAINVEGKLILTPNKIQKFEISSDKIIVLKEASDDYLIQKNEISLETLREYPHLRHRTKLFRAIMRVRSTLALEIHNFFNKHNFLYMNSPIITSNDGEGAGETFQVINDNDNSFFSKPANLCVTGQLHAEAYALGFEKVYTFGPTFRAENSHTQRHMAEFWMIEPEVAFYNLKDIINLAVKMLKNVIKSTIDKLKPEFLFLDKVNNNQLLSRLNNFINQDLKIIDYEDALKLLNEVKNQFENQELTFGVDLGIEHEKYLCEKKFNRPVAIINYPKEIKAFYMYQNDDQKTVAAFDLLVPGVGELIGGSQRETNYDKLKNRIKELNIDENDLQWYLDLRRFGDASSSGFGVGFERLIMYVTGVENIRDTIPFPRTVNNLRM